jgi:hypothetical protein
VIKTQISKAAFLNRPETGRNLEIPDNRRNVSIHLLFSEKEPGSPDTLVPPSHGNTLAAFQCHRNQILGTRDAEVSRRGAMGWVQTEERNLFKPFSTSICTEEHGEGVFFGAKCVVKTVGDDDMIIFRL